MQALFYMCKTAILESKCTLTHALLWIDWNATVDVLLRYRGRILTL